MRWVWCAVALGLSLGAAPQSADAELDRLLMIGDVEVPGEDAAGAFRRLTDNTDNLKVLASEITKILPDEVPDEQLSVLAKLARVARDRAVRWQSAAIHHKHALSMLTAVHDLAAAVRKRTTKTSVDAHLAYADALVALSLERINRRDRVSFEESFGAGSKVCLDAASVDKARAEDCAVLGAQLLRLGIARAGHKAAEVLDQADAALDGAGSNGVLIQAERARILLARAQLLMKYRKKADAKAATLKGLELIAPQKDAHAAATGAFNDLVAVAIENKWTSNKTAFVDEAAAKGGFTFSFPTGAGWTFGNEGNLKGKGRFLLERRRPDGAWVEVGLASFDVELGYGEGDVSGAKPKAILQLSKQVWKSQLRKPKSGNASKKDVPGGFKYVSGYTLIGASRTNIPMTVFAWCCSSPKFTYVFSVLVDGKIVTKLPPQARAVLLSIKAE